MEERIRDVDLTFSVILLFGRLCVLCLLLLLLLLLPNEVLLQAELRLVLLVSEVILRPQSPVGIALFRLVLLYCRIVHIFVAFVFPFAFIILILILIVVDVITITAIAVALAWKPVALANLARSCFT